jgi:hypothetical protein
MKERVIRFFPGGCLGHIVGAVLAVGFVLLNLTETPRALWPRRLVCDRQADTCTFTDSRLLFARPEVFPLQDVSGVDLESETDDDGTTYHVVVKRKSGPGVVLTSGAGSSSFSGVLHAIDVFLGRRSPFIDIPCGGTAVTTVVGIAVMDLFLLFVGWLLLTWNVIITVDDRALKVREKRWLFSERKEFPTKNIVEAITVKDDDTYEVKLVLTDGDTVTMMPGDGTHVCKRINAALREVHQ